MPHSPHTLVVLASSLALAACTTTNVVTQTGIVPAPRGLAYDGQPLPKGSRVEGRYTSVVQELAQTDEHPTGNYVSRDHLGVAFRTSAPQSPATEIGVEVDTAWSRRAEPTRPGLDAPPSDAAWSFVAGARHSLAVGPQVRIGLGVDLGLVSVPVRVGSSDTERDEAPIFRLGVVPSYRAGPIALFGGLHVASEIEVPAALVIEDSFDAPEARAEGVAVIATGGVSYTTPSGLYLLAQVAKPMASELAEHGLQLDLAIGFDLGTKPQRAPDPAPPPAYPPYPYPPAPYPYPPAPAPYPHPPAPSPVPAPNPY